ncbi:MAG: dependent ligase [Deltaproteobacteria bacterium]|nr:dependent ligase [Deltaproteobacteria bacterium]
MKFVLEGEKLHGEFALVRMRKDAKSWLLLKKKDRNATQGDILKENRSVVSRKTLEEMLEAGRSKSFKQKKLKQIRLHETMESEDLQDAPVKPMAQAIQPMLATPVKEPFDDPDWIFEVKWDGYRAVAEIRDGSVSLYSRNGISFNKKFFPITEALRKCGFDAVLDGEIVVVDDQGRPDFQMLQHYQDSGSGHLLYYVFDLLHFRGHDLTALPLLRRKEFLDSPVHPKNTIQRSRMEGRRLILQRRQRKGTGRDHRQTFSKRVRSGQKEPGVAEGEDAAHAGGRDRRIHRTGRGQKIFRRPCLGRIRRRRVDVHRPCGRRVHDEPFKGYS